MTNPHGIPHDPNAPSLEAHDVWATYSDGLAADGPRHALEGVTFRVERLSLIHISEPTRPY